MMMLPLFLLKEIIIEFLLSKGEAINLINYANLSESSKSL